MYIFFDSNVSLPSSHFPLPQFIFSSLSLSTFPYSSLFFLILSDCLSLTQSLSSSAILLYSSYNLSLFHFPPILCLSLIFYIPSFLSVYLSVCLSVCLSVSLSICLSVCLSVCRCFQAVFCLFFIVYHSVIPIIFVFTFFVHISLSQCFHYRIYTSIRIYYYWQLSNVLKLPRFSLNSRNSILTLNLSQSIWNAKCKMKNEIRRKEKKFIFWFWMNFILIFRIFSLNKNKLFQLRKMNTNNFFYVTD